jgi:YVTN family beta-propeller protein
MIAAGRDIRISTRAAPWLPLLVGLVLVASVGGLIWAAGGWQALLPPAEVRVLQRMVQGTIWVANEYGDSITALDASSNRVVATLHGLPGPHDVQATPDGREVWVVSGHTAQVIVIDTALYTPRAVLGVGKDPTHLAFTPDGKTGYISNRGEGTVSVLDVAARRIVATIPVGGSPHGLAVSPEGRWLVVANTQDETVRLIDTATNTAGPTFTVGGDPTQVAFAPDGAMLYVLVEDQAHVARIDMTTRALRGVVALESRPLQLAIAPDNLYLLVVQQSPAARPGATLVLIDPRSFTIAGTVDSGVGVAGVAVDTTSRHVYLTNSNRNEVEVLDLIAQQVRTIVSVGLGPTGISFSPRIPVAAPAPELRISLPGQ